MYTRVQDEGKTYRNVSMSLRNSKVWRTFLTPVLWQLGRVYNSPTLKIVLYLIRGTEARAYLRSCSLLDNGQYSRIM